MPDCSDKELLDSQFVKKVEMWCCLLLGVKKTRKKISAGNDSSIPIYSGPFSNKGKRKEKEKEE